MAIWAGKNSASADNMPAVTRDFHFNWMSDQMLFDDHDYAIHIKDHKDYERMPLLEFRDIAERYGWDFLKMPKMNGLEFAKELRQAGLDGKLTFFGRPKKYDVETLNMNEPLNEIEANYWKDYSINGLLHMTSDYEGKEKNKHVESYCMSQMDSKKNRFIDLHVLDDKASEWLSKITHKYKDQ